MNRSIRRMFYPTVIDNPHHPGWREKLLVAVRLIITIGLIGLLAHSGLIASYTASLCLAGLSMVVFIIVLVELYGRPRREYGLILVCLVLDLLLCCLPGYSVIDLFSVSVMIFILDGLLYAYRRLQISHYLASQTRVTPHWIPPVRSKYPRAATPAPSVVRSAPAKPCMAPTARRAPGTKPRTKPSRPTVRKTDWQATSNGSAATGHEVAPTFQFAATKSRWTLADVIGMEKTAGRLLRAGEEILNATGQSDHRNGILLYGEPGNGKTFLAHALAGSLGLPVLAVSIGDLTSRWVNETSERLAQAFRDARAQAPCVLFLDEIDSLLVDRSHILQAESEMTRIVNLLLTELDQISGSRVVLIAATNQVERLDQAGSREGRFDVKIMIPPPDKVARLHLLRTELAKRVPLRAIDREALRGTVSRWEGFSVARIKAIATDAACLWQDAGATGTIGVTLLKRALRRVQGSLGDAIPEGTLELARQVRWMPAVIANRLQGLAARMQAIEAFEAAGGSLPTGVLFYGPPGTGKTSTVLSLCKTAGWAFISVAGCDLLAEGAIDRLIQRARNLRPCVVLIDEAEDILGERRFSGVRHATNRLLQAIDGSSGQVPDVLWIAATNTPDDLDESARRGGRFSEKFAFTYPTLTECEAIISDWLAASCARFETAATPTAIAQLIGQFAYADIEAILRQAVNEMLGRSGLSGIVSLADIAAARLVIKPGQPLAG